MQTDLIHTHYAARKGSPEQVLRQYMLGKAFLPKHFPRAFVLKMRFLAIRAIRLKVYKNRIVLVWSIWRIYESQITRPMFTTISFETSLPNTHYHFM